MEKEDVLSLKLCPVCFEGLLSHNIFCLVTAIIFLIRFLVL